MTEVPIVVTAIVRAKAGRADELETELRANAVTRADEAGNVAFIVSRSNEDDHDFHLCEVYADSIAHAEHRRLTRLKEDPHRTRLGELVERYTFTRGSLVSGMTQFSWTRDSTTAPNGDGLLERNAPTGADRPYPLAGLRVLDLSRVLAGPYVGRLLSDLGADVVKIEGPEGDVTRVWGEVRNGASGYYFQQNSGKRNISVDLKARGAVDVVLRLAAEADIVVENYRPGVMRRLGLGWETLASRNPRLIMLSISGWGQHSEGGERRAYAPIIHAQTGIIDRQAAAHGLPPTDPLVAIADYNAGLHGLVAVLAALHLRERTGAGQHIDLAMFDAMLATDHYAHHFIDGSQFHRLGGYIWDAPGGPILLAADYRHTWRQLSQSFALEDPAPAGSDLETKIATRRAKIASWMVSFPAREELERALEKAELIHSDILTSEQAFASADALARGVIAEVGDGAGGQRGVVQSPYRFSGASSGARGPAPAYGQHNAAVLRDWLGIEGDDLDALLGQAIFGNTLCDVPETATTDLV